MPLYDVKCGGCGAVKEIFRRYEERDHDLPVCACGETMTRTFLPPQVMRDIEGYQSPIDGKFIGSRSQHRDHLKRHGVIEYGNDMPKPRAITIPRESIRAEIKNSVEAMKARGTFRER